MQKFTNLVYYIKKKLKDTKSGNQKRKSNKERQYHTKKTRRDTTISKKTSTTIPKRQEETLSCQKENKAKRQTIIYKALHRK